MNEDDGNDDEEVFSNEMDEELDVNEDPEQHEKKMAQMRSYLPLLQVLISSCQKESTNPAGIGINRLKALYAMFDKPTKKMRLSTILKCEKILKGLSKKIKPRKLREMMRQGNQLNQVASLIKPLADSPSFAPSTLRLDLDDYRIIPDVRHVPLGGPPQRKPSPIRFESPRMNRPHDSRSITPGQSRRVRPCDPALLQPPTPTGWNQRCGPRPDYRMTRPDMRMTRPDLRMTRPGGPRLFVDRIVGDLRSRITNPRMPTDDFTQRVVNIMPQRSPMSVRPFMDLRQKIKPKPNMSTTTTIVPGERVPSTPNSLQPPTSSRQIFMDPNEPGSVRKTTFFQDVPIRPSSKPGEEVPSTPNSLQPSTSSRRIFTDPEESGSVTKTTFASMRQASTPQLTSRFTIGGTLSTNLKIEGSDPFKNDEDRLFLEEKSRNIEKLMENRFASMNAKKLTSTMINDSIRKINVPNTSDMTESPFSSTLDEMMSNLTTKFGGARSQTNTTQIPKRESLLQESDELSNRVDKFLASIRSGTSSNSNVETSPQNKSSVVSSNSIIISSNSSTVCTNSVTMSPRFDGKNLRSCMNPCSFDNNSLNLDQQKLKTTQPKLELLETSSNITNASVVSSPSRSLLTGSNIFMDPQSVRVPFLESVEEFGHSKSDTVSNIDMSSCITNDTVNCKKMINETVETPKIQLNTIANSSHSQQKSVCIDQVNLEQRGMQITQHETTSKHLSTESSSTPHSISDQTMLENNNRIVLSPLKETQEKEQFLIYKPEEVVDPLNVLQSGQDPIYHDTTTFQTEQEKLEEMIVKRPHQSLRSKLSDEISTLHKVGSYGGAVKGLVKRDNMPANRIASLKPGTLFDLMSEERPRPTTKRNNRSSSVKNPESGVIRPKSKDPNEIISNLSEKDFNNIIGALNPQGSAHPTNIVANTNIVIPNQLGQTPWNVTGNNQQINLHAQNVIINNINITPTEYNNTVNNSINHLGPLQNQTWPSTPGHSADMRGNKDPRRDPLHVGNQDSRRDFLNQGTLDARDRSRSGVDPRKDPSNQSNIDPRRDSINQGNSQIDLRSRSGLDPRKDPSNQSNIDPRRDSINQGNLDPLRDRLNQSNIDPRREYFNPGNTDLQRNPLNLENLSYGILPSTPSDQFENTPYSTPMSPFNSIESEQNTSYVPIVLQSDPFRSPCYDGSNTPDPYRQDPYTLSMQEDLLSNKNHSPYNTPQNHASSLLGNSPMVGTSPSFLGTPTSLPGNPPSLLGNPPSFLGNSPLGVPHSPYDGIHNRPSFHGTSPRVDYHDHYHNNYSDHFRMTQNRSVRNADLTYGAWKERRGRELEYERSFAKGQDSSSCYERAPGDRRDASIYRWNKDFSNSSSPASYDNRNRDHNRSYKDNLTKPPRLGLKESDCLQGLSSRDPRRRSIEDSAEQKDDQQISNSDVECKSHEKEAVSRSRDPRIRGRSSQREGGRSPVRERDRGRSPARERGRGRSPGRDRGRSRETRSPPRDRGRSRERYASRRSSNRDRSPYRKNDASSPKSSGERRISNDSYTSPLDMLYGKTTAPKTGLGYGFQKFKIPKLNKPTIDKPSNKANESNNDHKKAKTFESDKQLESSVDTNQLSSVDINEANPVNNEGYETSSDDTFENKDRDRGQECNNRHKPDSVSGKAASSESIIEIEPCGNNNSQSVVNNKTESKVKALDENEDKIEGNMDKRNKTSKKKASLNIENSEEVSNNPDNNENNPFKINGNQQVKSDESCNRTTEIVDKNEDEIKTKLDKKDASFENNSRTDSKERPHYKFDDKEVKSCKINANEANLDNSSKTTKEEMPSKGDIVENRQLKESVNIKLRDGADEINPGHGDLMELTPKPHKDPNEAYLRRSSRLNKNCVSNNEASLEKDMIYTQSCTLGTNNKTNTSTKGDALNVNPSDIDLKSNLTQCVKSKDFTLVEADKGIYVDISPTSNNTSPKNKTPPSVPHCQPELEISGSNVKNIELSDQSKLILMSNDNLEQKQDISKPTENKNAHGDQSKLTQMSNDNLEHKQDSSKPTENKNAHGDQSKLIQMSNDNLEQKQDISKPTENKNAHGDQSKLIQMSNDNLEHKQDSSKPTENKNAHGDQSKLIQMSNDNLEQKQDISKPTENKNAHGDQSKLIQMSNDNLEHKQDSSKPTETKNVEEDVVIDLSVKKLEAPLLNDISLIRKCINNPATVNSIQAPIESCPLQDKKENANLPSSESVKDLPKDESKTENKGEPQAPENSTYSKLEPEQLTNQIIPEIVKKLLGDFGMSSDKIKKFVSEIMADMPPEKNTTESNSMDVSQSKNEKNQCFQVSSSDSFEENEENDKMKLIVDTAVAISDENQVNTSVYIPDEEEEMVTCKKITLTKKKVGRRKKNVKVKAQTPKDVVPVKKNLPPRPNQRKHKNELEKLQDDISGYHDSDAIVAAAGPRLCRLQKEQKPQTTSFQNNTQPQISCKNKTVSKAQSESENSVSADSDSDSSDAELHQFTQKLKEKLGLKFDDFNLHTSNDTTCKIYTDRKHDGEVQSSSNEPKNPPACSSKKDIRKELDLSNTLKPSTSNELNPLECDKGESSITSYIDNKTSLNENENNASDQSHKNVHVVFEVLKHENVKHEDADRQINVNNKSLEECTDDLHNSHTADAQKKAKKKNLWKSGRIVNKKSKQKKNVSGVLDVASESLGVFEFNDEEELSDLSYFQEGEMKAFKCKLCSYSGRTIVSHYAISHPKDDVLISRMSPKAALDAVQESKIFFGLNEEEQLKFNSFKCRVCFHEFSRFPLFFEHMAVHTGEFRHECVKCGYRTSTKSGILKHCLSHGAKTVSKLSCRVLYKEPANLFVYCGYLCLICNFFQISQGNVKRHMENTHVDQDYSKIVKINFSKLNFDNIDIKESTDLEMTECKEDVISTEVSDIKVSELIITPDQICKSKEVIDQVETKDTNINNTQNEASEIPHELTKFTLPSENETEVLHSDDDECKDLNEMSLVNTDEDEESFDMIKGCFEPSPELENHVEFIEAEVLTSYKELCVNAMVAIQKGKNRRFKLDIIEQLLSKQGTSPETCEKTISLEEFLASRIRSKKVRQQAKEQAPDKSNEAITRRQLPDRSCKAKTGADIESESETPNEDSLYDLLANIAETNDMLENVVEDDVFIQSVEALKDRSGTPSLFENQVKRCKENLKFSQYAFEPRVVQYDSSLPKSSNLSEFTHIMKQISLVELKQVESNVCVGSLKVAFQNGALKFFCSVKTFNIVCEFKSSSLEEFGQHVNIMHHSTYWDGVCAACFCIFTWKEESHDKSKINTQSRAFCHLVREHLTFIKKSSMAAKAALQAKEGEEAAKPKLRVRRLSGDKLSTPAPETPPKVAEPVEESTSSQLCLRLDGDLMCSQPIAGPSSSSYHLASLLPVMEHPRPATGSPTKSQSEDWRGGHKYVTMNMVASFKEATSYSIMLTPGKLRDFYKCMGEKCTFTTMSSKAFLSHYDQHKLINLRENGKDDSWKKCCYCLVIHDSSKEFCVHIRKVHGHSTLQCSHCFYRAANVANVHFHHTIEHPKEDFAALQCEQRELNLPPEVDRPFTDFVMPLRCKECTNMVTYMIDTFCTHLEKHHSNLIMCHVCDWRFASVTALVQHYSKEHGIGVYQCLYCTFGSGIEAGMKGHLAYRHPNQPPKAIHRTDSSGTYEPNRERLRRIMFYKDEHQLFPNIIPLPQECPQMKEAVKETEGQARPQSPRLLSPDRPIILNVGSLGPDKEIIPPPPTAIPINSEAPELAPTPDVDPNYFKCGNRGCSFESGSASLLRSHLVVCDHARQSQRLVCVHCRRVFKQAGSLVDHMRTHGPQRFSCALCGFLGPIQSRVSSHMKSAHHVNSTTLVPANSLANDPDKDAFVVTPRQRRGNKPGRKPSLAKIKFLPHEMEDIPKAAIFGQPLGCALCVYETKVRSNLMRHISQHSGGGSVAPEEVVNPVPEKTEKMFDKMSCLAGSSHKKRGAEEDLLAGPSLYKYVPDTVRYQCHMTDCGYRSISETMLREHIIILHKDDTSYMCPHCDEVDNPLPIPIDQLGLHLKLHDCPLFRCCYCQFYSHIRRSIEGHQYKMHNGEPPGVTVVRGIKPNATPPPPGELRSTASGPSNDQGEEWYACLQCNFKTKKKKWMVSHGHSNHQMSKPFQCSVCKYESATDVIFNTHFKTYHPDVEDCHVIALYKKVVEHKRPTLMSIPPLWSRDMKRVKLIRGIKLDERGDAPPPVATCFDRDLKDLDILELKFGAFCPPAGGGLFQCPRCPAFQARNRQDMREHLYRDLEYKPLTCKICELTGTQKTKITKHINKAHNVDWDRCGNFIETNSNQELEEWVEKNLVGQQELMKDMPAEPMSRKRRRPSFDLGQEGKQPAEAAVGHPSASTGSTSLASTSLSSTSISLPSISTLMASSASPTRNLSSTVSVASTVSMENLDNLDSSWEPASEISSQAGTISGDETDDNEFIQVKKRRQDPSLEQRFMCEYCKVTTKQHAAMKLHTERIHPGLPAKVVELPPSPAHDKTEAFSCQHCKCVAVSVDSLRYHWSLVHKQSCLSFLYKMTQIYSEFEYECVWCKKRDSADMLARHTRDAHPEHKFLVNPVTVPKYKCSECKMVYNSVEILRRHFNMDHASHPFKFITVDTPKNFVSSEKKLTTWSDDTGRSRNNHTYKCFSCHFVSSLFVPMVKHVQRHYVTFGCNECTNVFATSFGMRRHVTGQHPGIEPRPIVLKCSDEDLYQAKRKIIVVSESGKKRTITEEEVLLAEKEERLADEIREWPSEPRVEKPTGKMTARKSTGSPRKHPPVDELPPPAPPARVKCIIPKGNRKKVSYNNLFVSFSSQGKNIKLPVKNFKKIVDIEVELGLNPGETQST